MVEIQGQRAGEQVIHSLWYLIATAWPIWLLLGMVVVIRIVLVGMQRRRLARSGIADIDQMRGHEFEAFLATLLQRFGYRVTHTGKTGDFGADLVIEKDGHRTVVQAKRWSTSVGVKAIQEVVAAKRMYRCPTAMVITNSTFTRAARTLAEANGVTLWNRRRLVKVMHLGQAPSID